MMAAVTTLGILIRYQNNQDTTMANHDNEHDNDDDGGVVTSLSLINSSKVINTPKMCAKNKGLRGQD